MADYSVHLSQAQHNEQLASKLADEPPFHDWGIPAAFYSAIHYVECWLFNNRRSRLEKHTETSIFVGEEGRFELDPHAWREKLVDRNLSRRAFLSFRNLRNASETARYLSLYGVEPSRWPKWLDIPASQHFESDAARKLVGTDLIDSKNELKLTL